MPLPGRRRGAPVDWLIVGLGNPGSEYRGTPHNIGFEVANRLNDRWSLGKPKARYRGLLTEGRTGPGGPRVAILEPQTYMNEAGRSVGPARGELQVPLDHMLVLHDEIDLPFGDIRVRLGGGLAGHNGLKSLKAALGSADFHRVRIGVGRPRHDRSRARRRLRAGEVPRAARRGADAHRSRRRRRRAGAPGQRRRAGAVALSQAGRRPGSGRSRSRQRDPGGCLD